MANQRSGGVGPVHPPSFVTCHFQGHAVEMTSRGSSTEVLLTARSARLPCVMLACFHGSVVSVLTACSGKPLSLPRVVLDNARGVSQHRCVMMACLVLTMELDGPSNVAPRQRCVASSVATWSSFLSLPRHYSPGPAPAALGIAPPSGIEPRSSYLRPWSSAWEWPVQ